jgi:hypothetical protein
MSMLNPWAIVGAIGLLIAVAFGGVMTGRKLERTHWLEEKAEMQKAQQAELLAEFSIRQREQLFHQATARKASADHETALSDLDKKYAAARAAVRAAGGLRIAATCPAAGTDQTPGAGRPDEASTGTVALPADVENSLWEMSKSADELAEQLRGLQSWIKESGHY